LIRANRRRAGATAATLALTMTIAGLSGVVTVRNADAQQGDPPAPHGAEDPRPLFEVTGFVGVGLGGNFRLEDVGNGGTGDRVGLGDHGAFALAADLQADWGSQYELFYGREATDFRGNAEVPPTGVTVEYLHLGGKLLFDPETLIKPYIAGGVGVTRFSPGGDAGSDTRFSASLGLGLQWPVSRHFSVRLEGRGFVTLVNPDTAIFCRSDESGLLCRIHGSGQTFLQGQLMAGATFTF